MKTAVAITLILMGGLLVLAPAIFDYLHELNVVSLLSRPGTTNVSIGAKMEDIYRFGCYAAGVAFALIGVGGSFVSNRVTFGGGQTMAQHD